MWTFNPIYKTVIWGGKKIAAYKNISSPLSDIGESWELSGVCGSESVVSSGPDKGLTINDLIRRDGAALLGKKNYIRFGDTFPLLIKFIDAGRDLSVQVHPSDELAHKRGVESGKTEMWYVIGADKAARLVTGFKRKIEPSEYYSLVESGEIMDVLNFEEVTPGKVFYIPAGRVHAIGKGSFVVEIQQTSDVTYRLYDYKRKDKDGKERELHTELAFDAINFDDTDGKPIDYVSRVNFPVNLVTTPYFTTNLLKADHELIRDYSEWDTFVAIICTQGSAVLTAGTETHTLTTGHTILIPASCRSLTIRPNGLFEGIETFIK